MEGNKRVRRRRRNTVERLKNLLILLLTLSAVVLTVPGNLRQLFRDVQLHGVAVALGLHQVGVVDILHPPVRKGRGPASARPGRSQSGRG